MLENNTVIDYAVCPNQHVKLVQLYWYHLMCAILLTLLSISAVSLNLIFLYTASKYKMRRTVSDHLYVMLSITDILQSMTVTPLYGAHLYRLAFENKIFCTFWIIGKAAGYLFGLWSAATILTITLELFLSVVHPFYHERVLSSKRVINVLLTIWLVTGITIILARAFRETVWRYTKVSITFCIFPIAIGIFFMHYKTYLSIRHMAMRCRDQTFEFQIMLKSKRKLLRTALYILITFLICFLPMGITSVYSLFLDNHTDIDSFVLPVTETFVLSNAFFDPFVYYFRLKRIRRLVKSFFCFRKHQISTISPGRSTSDIVEMKL